MIRAFNYIIARIPNISEFFYSICFNAFISTIFEKYINQLGKDPTAKFIIQDSTTAASVLWLKNQHAEVGSTGDTYNEGSVISIDSKVICKGIIIKAATANYNDTEKLNEWMSYSSKFSNYPCEVISRIPVIASIEMLKANVKYEDYTGYFNAFIANAKFSWVEESFGGGVIKILVATQVEEVVKYANYSEEIKNYSQKFDNLIVNFIIPEPNSNYTLEGDVWSKMDIVHKLTDNQLVAYGLDILMFGNSMLSNIITGTINHYLFSPFTRAARDSSETYIKDHGSLQFYKMATMTIGCLGLVKYVVYPAIVESINIYDLIGLGADISYNAEL